MSKIFTLLLLAVGLINFLPIAGLLGSKNLESAYKVTLGSSDLAILMQHRALLFGLLGGFVWYSLFSPLHQNAAMLMAGISMIGFAVLFHVVGSDNSAMTKVLTVDYLGIFLLVLAVIIKFGFIKPD